MFKRPVNPKKLVYNRMLLPVTANQFVNVLVCSKLRCRSFGDDRVHLWRLLESMCGCVELRLGSGSSCGLRTRGLRFSTTHSVGLGLVTIVNMAHYKVHT